MSSQYLAEIRIISWNFPPRGWAFCNGQVLLISQNQALFSLLGTTYGGNGVTTFALPNLQARVPFHIGNGLFLGQAAGESSHLLSLNELPAHNHVPMGNVADADQASPAGHYWARGAASAYSAVPNGTMAVAALGNIGGSQPHENMSPYLVLNFVIALTGIYPSRT